MVLPNSWHRPFYTLWKFSLNTSVTCAFEKCQFGNTFTAWQNAEEILWIQKMNPALCCGGINGLYLCNIDIFKSLWKIELQTSLCWLDTGLN